MNLLCEAWLFNELCETLRAFLGDVAIGAVEEKPCLSCYCEGQNFVAALRAKETTKVFSAKKTFAGTTKPLLRRAAKTACYLALKQWAGHGLPWGALTGIRPTKLYYELARQGEHNIPERLQTEYDLSPVKARLLESIVKVQGAYPPPEYPDLFVSLPFCPSRCAYCSFSTTDSTKLTLLPAYLQALKRELQAVRELAPRLRCIYVGGGTPTVLSCGQLRELFSLLGGFAPQEYCLEAGRPDTLTAEKLDIARQAGVNRLCLNPQTFHNATLNRLGRGHTVEQLQNTYEMARERGFANINMDLIAGLPGENAADFLTSATKTAALRPENITLHVLSKKRGSRLAEEGFLPEAGLADALQKAGEQLRGEGYEPYYLYRQKYQENLENVGYCLPGYAGLYNMDIMEETNSILAVGAGAIGKRLFASGRIERLPNPKSVFVYMERVLEQANKLRALFTAPEEYATEKGNGQDFYQAEQPHFPIA